MVFQQFMLWVDSNDVVEIFLAVTGLFTTVFIIFKLGLKVISDQIEKQTARIERLEQEVQTLRQKVHKLSTEREMLLDTIGRWKRRYYTERKRNIALRGQNDMLYRIIGNMEKGVK